MMILLMFVVFLGVALVLSMVGMKMWIQPEEAIERVTGNDQEYEAPTHPSLVFHELVKKLGDVIPASPKDVSAMQKRMIRAGIKGPNALKILYGSKVAGAVILPVLMSVLVASSASDSTNKLLAIAAAAAADRKSVV